MMFRYQLGRHPKAPRSALVGISGRITAVAALVGALMLWGYSMPTSQAQPDNGVARYGACLAAQKQGDLLILVDESSSLQNTDSKAARVQAAKYLVHTLGRYADRIQAKLDVAIAGFAENYVSEHNWTPLTDATSQHVGDQLSTLASKNAGIDTDYWLALDGARQALASRGSGVGGADRCQAIAWFSDGKIDFTARPLTKPYADGVRLDSPNGVAETVRQATESICRPGGLADQLRARGIVMLGVGLGDAASASQFDVMSAISTGRGLNGMPCGNITEPTPGDFYRVTTIDDMLFAFDSLYPDPGVPQRKGPVCELQVCPEARHDFVLDRSIKSVKILGSGGTPGIVPYLISPSGQKVELPNRPGQISTEITGTPVQYEWLSDSSQTITIRNSGSTDWAGKWAIVYVDTTGQHPDAVSRVSIHIITDIFPVLIDAANLAWHSGQALKGLIFGLADGQGHPVKPAELAGSATMSATLEPDGAPKIPLLVSVPKTDIGKPVDADLTAVKPGHAILRMSLTITTAPATDRNGAQIAPGTTLSPQDVEMSIQILPKLGLPTPASRIDFGTVQAAKGANGALAITGPGCVWIAADDKDNVIAAPDGIGNTRITSPANGPETCLKVPAGQTAGLPVTLRTDRDGRGGLSGTVPVHLSPLANPSDAQVIDVPFAASLTKPLSKTNFVLVFLAALLLGPGIPLALLYAGKWYAAKIPGEPMLAERIPVEVDPDSDTVIRNGSPFAMADTDLLRLVPGLAGGARSLVVLGVTLTATVGRSPFGTGHVVVDADGRVSVGSALPGTDRTGLKAVLPLAVHNKWVVLHDPGGPPNKADVLLLAGGRTDNAARQRIYEDIGRRLPELLAALRNRAANAGLAGPTESEPESPYGQPEATTPASDPFTTAEHTARPGGFDSRPFDPFDEGASCDDS
ncbi:vWA domain-containing protein [Mycobacterium persicum]|uniref:vWA domain-containing protein n=1 Tax=Mycobacterium persicum TaxID=1487726 RepID=UPI0020D1BCE9|nr:vWA domain-containing protein [Mycobacterium persicum]